MTLLFKIPGAFADPTLPVFGAEDAWFTDTFTRPDANTLGSTEGPNPRPWSVWTQSGTPVAGVSGGEGFAYRADAAGHTLATVDATTTDGTLELTMGTSATGAQVGPVFRAVDIGNYFRIVNAQGAEYRLQRFNSGALTRLDSGFGVTPAAGDVIRIVLNGPSITVHINGTQVGQFTDTGHQAATRHGFYNNVQGSTIRDVKFTA